MSRQLGLSVHRASSIGGMELEDLALQLTRIEQKLDWIAARLGEPPVPAMLAQSAGTLAPNELSLLQSGKKIQAIKEYRQRTNVSLREAKRTVDQYG